ncbi:MAG: hypothetical protein AAF772_14690 [Acidobacteriota bacterium]
MLPRALRRTPIWLLTLALAAALASGATAQSTDDNPWSHLATLRASLVEAGPVTSRFVQTYVPAGFETGDTEAGHLSLMLPRCLRWNYDDADASDADAPAAATAPAPIADPLDEGFDELETSKNFLLCDGLAHEWNDGEDAGRRFPVDAAREIGLDLLLVDLDTLKARYVAEGRRGADGGPIVVLATPPDDEGRSAVRAELHLDPAGAAVRTLSYVDREGNHTRFALEPMQPLSHQALFQPPAGMTWIDE